MINVKVVIKGVRKNADWLLRKVPGGRGEWGPCRFITDPNASDYDWLVVYDDLPSCEGERYSTYVEKLACPRENTIFMMAEPAGIKTYGYYFLNQFGTVISCHRPTASPRSKTRHTIPGLIWFHGMCDGLTYEQMQSDPPLHKTALLSTISSAKSMRHTLHEKRKIFTLALHERLPEMNVYGSGFRPLEDKREALDPYRYHVAMENTIFPNYITEKITDAFLGLCLPFYVGAPNLLDYFPAESYIQLDPDKPDEAAQIIREAIAHNEYEKRLPALIEARRRVMEEYNMFAIVRRIIEEKTTTQPALAPQPSRSKKPDYLYSRRGLIKSKPWYGLRFVMEKAISRAIEWNGIRSRV
jgi:hypothetical protein